MYEIKPNYNLFTLRIFEILIGLSSVLAKGQGDSIGIWATDSESGGRKRRWCNSKYNS